MPVFRGHHIVMGHQEDGQVWIRRDASGGAIRGRPAVQDRVGTQNGPLGDGVERGIVGCQQVLEFQEGGFGGLGLGGTGCDAFRPIGPDAQGSAEPFQR